VGSQAVREAIRVHGRHLHRLAVDVRCPPRVEALVRFAQDQGVSPIDRVDRATLDRWAKGIDHQGVVAYGPPLKLIELPQLLAKPSLLAIALDQIQDPQNFGAVIRSAVAVADAEVIFGEHSAAPLSPATFRASAGAIEHARLCRVSSLREALLEARGLGIRVLGLDPHAQVALHELPHHEPTIVVLGSEHDGLQRSTRRLCSEFVRLSATSRIDSLNAAVAAGIALHVISVSRMNTGN
jgi:23S rRNA (guanosine2251-2'-O)-methyltransferase